MVAKIPPAAPKVASPPRERDLANELVILSDVPADQKYVVKKDDTLWGIAKSVLGGKASDAEILKLVNTIKKDNPELASAQRKHGDRILVGDEVRLNRAKAGTQTGKPPAPADGGKAEAEAQMEAAKKARTAEVEKYRTGLHAFAEGVRQAPELSPSQQDQIRGKLKEVKASFPELAESPEVNVLRTRLPPGDPLRPPGTPVVETKPGAAGAAGAPAGKAPVATAEAQKKERADVSAMFDGWAKQATATGSKLNRDERMVIGAALDEALGKFPDLKERPSVQSLIALKPMGPDEAKAELAEELKRTSTGLAAKKELSNPERRELGKLMQRIEVFAPILQRTDEFDSLKARQPITARAALIEDLPGKLDEMAKRVATKELTVPERAEVGTLMQQILSLTPELAKTPQFEALKAHAPLVQR